MDTQQIRKFKVFPVLMDIIGTICALFKFKRELTFEKIDLERLILTDLFKIKNSYF